MKVQYSKSKRGRIKKSHGRPLWIEPEGNGWWYVYEDDEWYNVYDNALRDASGYMTHRSRTTSYYVYPSRPIWSLKAAIRKIRKWKVPEGTRFKVCLPWIGHEMIVTKK